MPCTIAPGQLVLQSGYEGRVWQITHRYDDERWGITIVAPGLNDARLVGEAVRVTEGWLQSRCTNFATPKIDPPCGDGPQTVRAMCNNVLVEEVTFGENVEMIAFVTDYLTVDTDDLVDDFLSIEWYGWDAVGVTWQGDPDMTATVVDGEISWWSEG